MKIDKLGTKDPNAWKKAVCHKRDKYDSDGCKAELSLEYNDLIVLFWKGSHFPHFYSGYICPACDGKNLKSLLNIVIQFLMDSQIERIIIVGRSEARKRKETTILFNS